MVGTTSLRGAATGEEFVISHGNEQARVTQVGAALRSYAVDGLDVIDGFGADERARDGRGQVLAPWPNRLTDGHYRYGRHDCQAPLNEPSRHNAIHGLVRWLDWSPVSQDTSTVTLSCAVRPQPGYEWPLTLEVTYALGPAGLTVSMQASNTGAERAPFGVGFHPYLTVGTATIDGLDLQVPGAAYLVADASSEQPVMTPVTTTPWDFTRPRRIDATQLDTAFGELTRDVEGRAVARLSNPLDGRAVELWVEEQYRYLMVYTGDNVGEAGRRRAAVAVEPMTCPPNAFRSGADLIEIERGETWRGRWGLRPDSLG